MGTRRASCCHLWCHPLWWAGGLRPRSFTPRSHSCRARFFLPPCKKHRFRYFGELFLNLSFAKGPQQNHSEATRGRRAMQLSVPPSFSTVPMSQSDKTLAGQVLTIQHLVPARPPPLPVSGRHLRLKVSISSKCVWPLSPASPEKGRRALAFLLGVVQEMLTLCPSCPGALPWLCWRWYGERDRVAGSSPVGLV